VRNGSDWPEIGASGMHKQTFQVISN